MMKPNMIAFSLAMLISVPAMAQFCATDTIRPTINPEQMIDNGDGTVTDAKTGLMWMQCSLGQTWSANGCSGSPMSYTWENALQATALFNGNGGFADKVDWRLPNIKELGSLVERQCVRPAINLTSFPDTPSATYFSSTVKTTGSGSVEGGRYIDFTTGSDLSPEVNSLRFVRLVREN